MDRFRHGLLMAAVAVMVLTSAAVLVAQAADPAPPRPQDVPVRAKPPIIVLKLDDFRQHYGGRVHPRWQKVADYLAERKIKAGFGVICDTLENAEPGYVQWIRRRQESGQIEFWFHGWDHKVHQANGTKYNEFNGRSYEEQKQRLEKSQKLAKEKLGFAFRAFGPGGGTTTGAYNAATLRVMVDDPDIRVMLFPGPLNDIGRAAMASSGGTFVILDRVWQPRLERAVGIPDFDAFLPAYAKDKERDYYVFQGHPAMWTDERFEEFKKTVEFLQAQGAVFMTPSEAAAAITTSTPGEAAPRRTAPATAEKANTPVFEFGQTKGEKKLFINTGVAGKVEVALPWFAGVKGGQPSDAQLSADRKTLRFNYAVGGSGKITLDDAVSATVSFSDLPEQAGKVRMKATIPGLFKGGGKYAIGGGPLKAFPKDKPQKPFLFQGSTTDAVSVLHPVGAGFALSGFRPGTFQQLQDNREWNNGTFTWWFSVPLTKGDPRFILKLATPEGAAVTIKPHIDRFGQIAAADFPQKVTNDEQLKADVAADRAYYASLQPPQFDRFGGLPGSGEKYGLKKTGYFHVDQIGKTPVLVDPDGNLFFQLGICTLATPVDDYTLVKGRESIYEWLPGRDDPAFRTAWRPNDSGVFSFYLANRIRKYGRPFDRAAFFAETIERVRKWGFNSAGGFTETPPEVVDLTQQQSFPHVAFLPAPSKAAQVMHRVWDPFDETIDAIMDAGYQRLAVRADDPQLIGYFLVNEPRLQNVPRVVPALKASESPSKARLVRMLQEKYRDIAAYNRAWGAQASSFDDLKETPLVVATKEAGDDITAFYAAFLERRYSLVNKYFRKYDPNHLLIGDRWMVDTANSEVLLRTAGKYYDVISVNYYTAGIDKGFLQRLHEWSGGRPLLLSEFYYDCGDQGLQVGGRKMGSQTQRGQAYRNYVEQAAGIGFVVGIQWFSHVDQAATGRFFQGFNGEGANIGLVNVADRPYKDFLAEVMKTNYRIYSVVLGETPAFVFDDPRFTRKQGGRKGVGISRMSKAVVLDGQSQEWPTVPATRVGADGLIWGENADNFEGAFRLAWDEQYLYLLADVTDPTPMQNALPNNKVWAGDCIELFVGPENLEQGGALQFGDRQVLLRGAKAEGDLAASVFVNAPRQYDVRVAVTPGLDGKSYTLEAAVPFEALGFVPEPGQDILFDLCINDATGGSRRAVAWNGTARKERGAWGKATFVK